MYMNSNPCGLEPQLIKLEFIIYPPKLKVVYILFIMQQYRNSTIWILNNYYL